MSNGSEAGGLAAHGGLFRRHLEGLAGAFTVMACGTQSRGRCFNLALSGLLTDPHAEQSTWNLEEFRKGIEDEMINIRL